MNDLNRMDPEYLLFLVRKGRGTRTRELLGDPFALETRIFETGPVKTIAALNELRALAPPELARFLDLHLITHILLFKDHPMDWLMAWVQQEVDFDLHFPGLPRERILSGRWKAVPILVVHGKARVVYFMTGLLTGERDGHLLPDWADGIMDDPCKSAIQTSVASSSVFPIAEDKRLFCFPLLAPGESIQVKGTSLGLGLALGFLSAARNGSLPRNVIASGSMTGTGGVGPAEELEKKIGCAEKKGFSVFLLPSCTTIPGVSPRLELIPVASLREAWMFVRLHTPGRSEDLMLLSKMLRDPEVFVSNVDMVETEWLDWVKRERMVEPDHVLKASNGLARLVDKIGLALRKWELDRAGAMAALVSPSGFDAMASSSPLTALRFCTHNMALANHRGDLEPASVWSTKGDRVFEKAMKADINVCADFLNNRFVVRHNRYEFSPLFHDQLNSIVRCLEDRYVAQCRGGCSADRVLGEIYGSICQNFGFCGPRYLSLCECYAEKAMQAFGGGDVPELKEDLLRQLVYLAYAALDAGDHEKAQAVAFRHFEVTGWGELWACHDARDLSRWQHALLARVLAESSDGSQKTRYMEWAFQNRTGIMGQGHPWQLWLYNLGRIALQLNRKNDAASLWEESLRLCRVEANGPTIRAMALLPLSGLHAGGHLSCADLASAKIQVLETVENLNPEHFGMVRRVEFEEVLQHIWEQPGDLFPFTCR